MNGLAGIQNMQHEHAISEIRGKIERFERYNAEEPGRWSEHLEHLRAVLEELLKDRG